MPVTFRDLIAQNKRQTAILVTVFILFCAVVVMVLSLAILAYLHPDAVRSLNWAEAALCGGIAAMVAGLFACYSYYSGDSVILAMTGAKEIQHGDDPQLFNVVEEMAIAAGVPMPKVYLIYDEAMNAFATGRDPKHAAVAITTGLRHRLTRDELQGVMAHEMAHVRNYDIRLMMMLAVLVGLVVMLCDLFWQMMWYAPRGGSSSSNRDSDRKDGGNIILVVVIVLAILLAIIAPFLAQIIQLAVSRQREYLADASAVEFTRNPTGLANALRKLEADPHELKSANRGTAHLFISNPVKKFRQKSSSMFSSHPPTEERIARLEQLAHEYQQPRA
jgi:heat shock protein HtpX